jgi:hypothetical protein
MEVQMKWRTMFGPSREEVWRQLSTEIQGRFIDGTWTKGARVEADHLGWTVTLDTYVVPAGKTYIPCTRMRAPFVNPGRFRFTVYRKSVFSGVGKLLGMQDIEVGDDAFDRDFIIKGTDDGQVRTLLSRVRLRELIATQPEIHLSVKDDEGWFATRFPDGVDEVYFSVTGIIKDLDRLKHLFDLFAEVLDALVDVGTATTDPAGVDLE